VLEKGRAAGAATDAAGGMLSPLGEAPTPGPFLAFALQSLERYPAFVSALGIDADAVGLRACGKLLAAFSGEGLAALEARAGWLQEAGFDARLVDGPGARALEPALGVDVVGGLHLPTDGVVDNRRLGSALVRAVRAAGATLRERVRVRGIDTEAGRIRGVILDDGERVAGDVVVLAAGAWSGRVDGLPRALPVRPVRGQMLALSLPAQPLDGIVGSPGAYLIPRATVAGPRVVIGATQEEVGFREGNDGGAIEVLRRAAERAAPVLAGATEAGRWWGFRPGTPDDLPIVGADPDLPGLVYATGHFRNGILLAPATAHRVARLVLEGDPSGLEAFRPDRFGD
jgi:glycine oxidase